MANIHLFALSSLILLTPLPLPAQLLKNEKSNKVHILDASARVAAERS